MWKVRMRTAHPPVQEAALLPEDRVFNFLLHVTLKPSEGMIFLHVAVSFLFILVL